jgi:hypothetical protein
MISYVLRQKTPDFAVVALEAGVLSGCAHFKYATRALYRSYREDTVLPLAPTPTHPCVAPPGYALGHSQAHKNVRL